ncbi:MAG: hypothetical protein KDA89_09120 [Planctomycetaceae bacterium]|nr:hypothetical protein [Planctomycetaceae bacterium]
MNFRNLFLPMCIMVIGCGEGAPPELTPEKEAEYNQKMQSDMSSMMGDMQQGAPPGTPKK